MALFNKLFFPSSSSATKRKPTINSRKSQNYLGQFPFNTDQVRILLYRECDTTGRRLLFDSNAIEKIDLKKCAIDKAKNESLNQNSNFDIKKQNLKFLNNGNSFVDYSSGITYKHSRPCTSDISELGEMIFGALAMSFRGTSLKIHWLQSPVRILISQVFLSPMQSKLTSNKNSSGNIENLRNDKNSTESCTSFNSISMPFTVCVNKNLNLLSEKNLTETPLITSSNAEINLQNTEIYSPLSPEDSGYSVNEPWTSSTDYQCSQYSTRSSLGSIFTDSDNIRKFSTDSAAIFSDSNTSSDVSLKRRILRNISTSFENRNSMNDFVGFISDNFQTQTNGGSDGCVSKYNAIINNDITHSDSRSNPEIMRSRTKSNGVSVLNLPKKCRQLKKRSKIGLAICITMSENFENEMDQFCCEHIALFESMLYRLRAFVETAYINHKNFLQIMVNAWQSETQWIRDIFTAPRIPSPFWISINNGDTKIKKSLAETFMKELNWLLSLADTKNTNFFISTMLTAVLTYHLGWVTTTEAFNSDEFVSRQKEKLKEVSQQYPYNPLWAQMSDLYGCIGNPPRISRTIIYGTDKSTVEKVIHMLSYFIRCQIVNRSSKIELTNNELLSDMISKINSTKSKKENSNKNSGLTRSPTFRKSLFLHPANYDSEKTFVSNDNLNSSLINLTKENDECEKKTPSHEKILFTVTTPENVEMALNYSEFDSSMENNIKTDKATEYEEHDISTIKHNENFLKKVFLKVEDNTQEGVSVTEANDLKGKMVENIKDKNLQNSILRKSISMTHLAPKNLNLPLEFQNNDKKLTHTSLTDLLNSKDKNNFSQKESFTDKSKNTEGVVFVLGDNEALVNIKKSNEDLASKCVSETKLNVEETKSSKNEEKKQCCHHHKKHSGVKFNFEKYPQIATNYMKNKNLDLSSYDFLDKSSKFEDFFKFGPSTSTFQVTLPKSTKEVDDFNDSCEFCKHCSSTDEVRVFQTPSNATELEFETEDDNFPAKTMTTNESDLSKTNVVIPCKPSTSNFNINTETIVENQDIAKQDLLIESFRKNFKENGMSKSISFLKFEVDKNQIPKEKSSSLSDFNENRNKKDFDSFEFPLQSINGNVENIQLSSSEVLPSNTFNKANNKTEIELIELPIPSIESKTEINSGLVGFVPSLFINVSDHYIPDMILQGTLSSPEKWEFKLKQDLILSSHSAAIMPIAVENVAVIADMTKWDVKVISSQTSGLPNNDNSSTPIGMSQLVSTMLETVHAMSCSGVPASQCLSFMEAQLQHIYMQSETLAAFLLSTDFCSLNTVISALDLSANDVPLLLSVASVHTPQVTRKYGISFR